MELIQTKIYIVRGVQVMLDSDKDFMFQLSKKEFEDLRCQIGTTNLSKTRIEPFVFTERGIYMLATVINSTMAVDVTKTIMRTFTKMREFATTYKDIIDRLESIEQTIKTDQQQINYNTERLDEAFHLLNQILHQTKEVDRNLIGFRPKV